jgi:hypothetical protein
MSESFDIFVSYSTDDGHLVDGLVRLLKLSGRRVFIDRNSIQPGDLWERSLRQAITGSEQIILLWCCHSSESKWVAVEIEQAVEESKPIIPLLLCGKFIPEPVAKYQWIDLRYVVTHPCAHTETESIRNSPESRYIALTLPRGTCKTLQRSGIKAEIAKK